jgi:hypothetical protein
MSEPRVTVLLMLWAGFRPLYCGAHVRSLARQLREHLKVPHRIVLLTDDIHEHKATALEIDAVEEIPYEPQVVLCGIGGVNCFRRLRVFDPKYSERFGTPFVLSLDLDALVLRDLTPLVEHAMSADFAILRGRMKAPYNGGLWSLRVGAHADVWSTFDWRRSPEACRATGLIGSDQVWMSLRIPDALTIGPEHGAYFRGQYLEAPAEAQAQARLVTFAGPTKPWSKTSQRETPQFWRTYRRFAAERGGE